MPASSSNNRRQDRWQSPWRPLWTAAFLAVLAVAAYLRFDGLGEASLWLDEILHLEKARDTQDAPWQSWLTGVSVDRENGALYYAGQLLGLRLFDGELGVRLVPALTGLATVAVLFFVGLSTGRRQVGFAAAALLAVSPLAVYYSREGRPYAAVMLSAALFLLLALEHRRPWTKFAVYGLCIATAYLGAVSAPVLISVSGLAALEWLRGLVVRRRRYGHFALAAVAGLAVSALLFPTVTREGRVLGTGEYAAKWDITEPVSRQALDRLLASLSVSGLDSGSSSVLSFLFLALAVWGGICLARRDLSKAVWVVGMCVLPIAGWLTALVAFGHWYNVRYTSVGLPAFLVLVAVSLVDLGRRLWQPIGRRTVGERFPWVADAVLAALLVLLLAPTWRAARVEPLQKPDWRGVAELIGGLASPGEPVIARDPWSETCIRHYLRRLPQPLEVLPVNFDVARARELTKRHPHGWVVAAGFRRTDEFQAWTASLAPIMRSRLANFELFFFPNFATFLAQPDHVEALAPLLAQDPGSATRQDFTSSDFLLGPGWSYAEQSPDGTTFRWALGSRAEIALLRPAGIEGDGLRMRLLPFPTPDRGPQSVEIAVDSRPWARVTLKPGWNEITVQEPAAERQPTDGGRPAVDLVTFDFAWYQSPRELDPGSPDTRQLAVAFDFVETVRY